jgi:F-type H+-transporting ATPase subunit alpha
MTITGDKIVADLTAEINKFVPSFDHQNVGKIVSLSDGIAILNGLSEAKMGELLEFENGTPALVLNLKKNEVGAAILGEYKDLKEGDEAKSTGTIAQVPVSEKLLGRVINPQIVAIDGKGDLKLGTNAKFMPIEKIAPGIISRESVDTPLQTGIKAIDSMIPIGRGQRELIIGDRSTGKTAIAIDTIINSAKQNKIKGAKKVISIYVAIGQKQSKTVQIVDKLNEFGAMEDTIVVAASSSDPVALQYIAPYAGSAIAEYFMDKGEDVLIVYDDLTKHAWAYRQISLILKRPSGREAYPGDIFYLHSRLLERACKLNKKLGGGSITALPIIETQAQDISAYIPTNVISITDGQIYLESDLFYKGIKPAINVGLSVSRVGGAAQLKAMKKIAGKLRLDIAQFNELSAFAQFGSEMDAASKIKIDRGTRIVEILKQEQYRPVPVEEEILQIWFVSKGYLDTVSEEDALTQVVLFTNFAFSKKPELREALVSKEGLSESNEKTLEQLATNYVQH